MLASLKGFEGALGSLVARACLRSFLFKCWALQKGLGEIMLNSFARLLKPIPVDVFMSGQTQNNGVNRRKSPRDGVESHFLTNKLRHKALGALQ